MSPVTAAAAAAATGEVTPTEPDARQARENRRSERFWKLFFPIAFALMAVWFVVILGMDGVPKETFDPTGEFALDPLFGTYDGFFAINKGVVYLLIALVGSVLFAVYANRRVVTRLRQETKVQSAIEGVYEFAYDGIAGMLPQGKLFNRYMPYVASIFVFVLLLNLTSFVPLPLNTHHNIGSADFLYAFGVYAVTSNIFCTATLALLTFGIYHYEGVKAHGVGGYLKSWSAGQSGFAGGFVWVVEALTNLVLKPLSLAVRLFANMLSGHILILLMMALAGIIGGAVAVSVLAQTAGTLIALAFYLFEMVLVAGLQAYIFAVLSAIYISSAAEEHH
jgi:F-type H+-transporting ATPase subunit a